jgi:hypothetical protein
LAIFASSVAQGQILPLKPSANQPEGKGAPDAVPQATEEEELLPLWERQFFRSLDAIDAAIATAEAESAQALENANNPLLRTHMLERASSRFVDAVRGLDLVVHFRLTDIHAEKKYSRTKQAFQLTLGSPDFPSHSYRGRVTVTLSPQQARRLQIGSVVRVSGQLLEKGHRAFGVVCFTRRLSTPPLPGDDQAERRIGYPRFKNEDFFARTEFGKYYSLALYLDDVRLIRGNLLPDYREFAARYQSRLDGYASEAAADADGDAVLP